MIRSRTWWQCNPTSFEKLIALTVGAPIFSANDAVGELARAPLASSALFDAVQLTVCWPIPLTGTRALAPGSDCDGAPSTEHAMALTPEGPAVAVAVTYWVPAVEGASVGPERMTGAGVWLSNVDRRRRRRAQTGGIPAGRRQGVAGV